MKSQIPLDEEIIITKSFITQPLRPESFFFPIVYLGFALILSLVYWLYPQFGRNYLCAYRNKVLNQQYYRLFTGMLLHSNFTHFLSNAPFILIFGAQLNNYFSWRLFPLLAVITGIITHGISIYSYDYQVNLLGSSGLVYVLYGMWLPLLLISKKHMKGSKKWLKIAGFSLVMFIPASFSPRTSYRTHYIGLICGLLVITVYIIFNHKKIEARNFALFEKLSKEKYNKEASGFSRKL
ncbi:MAG: rhomboid family intramembrane serine protease [Myxococcota bacterium]